MIQDAVKLLREHGIDKNLSLAAKAEVLRDKLASEGKSITARDVARNIRGIANAAHARFIISLMEDPPSKEI